MEVLIAIIVMPVPSLGWRWLLGLSALPILAFCIMCYVSSTIQSIIVQIFSYI